MILPQSLSFFMSILGENEAIELVKQHGGKTLYIGENRLHQPQWSLDSFNCDQWQQFHSWLDNRSFDFNCAFAMPTLSSISNFQMRQQARQLRATGMLFNDIAYQLGKTTRWAQQACNGDEQTTQPTATQLPLL